MKTTRLFLGLLLALPCLAGRVQSDGIPVIVDDPSPMVEFGITRLYRALNARGHQVVPGAADSSDAPPSVRVTVGAGSVWVDLGPEAFRVTSDRETQRITVAGADERGAMYGLLELSERIRQGAALKDLKPMEQRPATGFRAIKFNLPYMSYRRGEALELHWDTCRDLAFWEAFLDMMAENRFNVLTLWSLHPFHYMIRPVNFPEACPYDDAELAECQALWTGLFRMAKERGIETYLVNWNIFVSPEFSRAHDVANWSREWQIFGEGGTSEIVERYTREVVTQVINEYPDLTGLGITLGERMGGMDADERRTWLERTFFAGMKEADRKIKFLYRAPLSANKGSGGSTSEENDRKSRHQIEAMDFVEPPVYVSFKYNWSHGHSSPNLYIVHGGPLSDAYWDPLPTHHRVLWTIRNEDFHFLRWGQPDFIRQHMAVANNPDYVSGYIIGAEMYIPALDYITAPGPHKTWTYAFDRQWLFYSVWGHLLYNPDTPDRLFEAQLEERFGRGLGRDLLKAWKLASDAPLHFACQYEGHNDHSLYCEGFCTWGENVSFIHVDRLIERPALDERYLNIREFVKAGEPRKRGALYPPVLADQLDRNAKEAMRIVGKLRGAGPVSPTLAAELTDIEAWSHYSEYFADKLRGAVALERYRQRGGSENQAAAVAYLEEASLHWKCLASAAHRYNLPELAFRTYDRRKFSWTDLQKDVDRDIEIARGGKPGSRATREEN